MSSFLEKALVIGAVTAGVGALGYMGADGKIAESIGGMEALPKALREGLGSGLQYMSDNVNWAGETISDALHIKVDDAHVNLRNAITAGVALAGITGMAAVVSGLFGASSGQSPSGVPYAPGPGPARE